MTKLETLTVPTDLGEWLQSRGIGESGVYFSTIDALFHYWDTVSCSPTSDFISKNKKELIEIILGNREYEVEEQKYYVIDKEDNILLIRGYGGIEKADNLKITNSGGGALKLTEQEIKDCDERFWAFAVKVEELEE